MQHSVAQATAVVAYLYNALKVKEKDKLNATLTTQSIIAQLRYCCGYGEINNDGQSLPKYSLRWPRKWLSLALRSPGFRARLEGNCIAWDQRLILQHFAFRQLVVLGAGGGQGTGSGRDGDISFSVLFGSVYHLCSDYFLKHPKE